MPENGGDLYVLHGSFIRAAAKEPSSEGIFVGLVNPELRLNSQINHRDAKSTEKRLKSFLCDLRVSVVIFLGLYRTGFKIALVPWQLKRTLLFRWRLRLVEDDTIAVRTCAIDYPNLFPV